MNYRKVLDTPEVYLVQVPFTGMGTPTINCYIIRDHGQCLVVDTGAPSNQGFAILNGALADLNVNLADTSFFLTHLHFDHAGLVDRIVPPASNLYLDKPDLVKAMPENRRNYALSFENRLLGEGVDADEARLCADSKFKFTSMFDIRRTLKFVGEGDRIDVGDLSLQVIDTAGHTPGHLSLFEPKSKSLFGGDHILFSISPGIGFFPTEADGLQMYLNNLQKVQDLQIDHLFHSHGALQDDFESRIDWLKDHHKRRCDQACEIIRSQPGILGRDLIQLLRWNVRYDSWSDLGVAQRISIWQCGCAVLTHLEKVHAIRSVYDEAGRRRYTVCQPSQND